MSTLFQNYVQSDSLGKGGEAFERGTPVIKDDSDSTKWVICPSGEIPIGYSLHDVRDFGVADAVNIYNSQYNTGVAQSAYYYNGLRNPHKPFLAGINDPIAVALGAGIVMEDVENYIGQPANNAYLKVADSGLYMVTVTPSEACARVDRGGDKAAGDKIRIISL